jgi:putative transposase
MASTLVFRLVRHVLGLVRLGPRPDDKDVEIAVLRHQLAVAHHQGARPRCAPTDRLILSLAERGTSVTLLVRDRDTKFVGSFDAAFEADGVRVVKTPVRAPRANAYADGGCAACGPSTWTGS